MTSCTGAGSGNAEIEEMQYGLKLSVDTGNSQIAGASETYTQPLRVKLSDTAGTPIAGVKVNFRPVGGATATILTPSSVTSAEGIAESRIKAPEQYGASFNVEALIEGTNLRVEFLLSTTPTGLASKIIVQTSHGEIESAGVPFSYIFRLADDKGNTVNFSGTQTVNLTVNTPAKSWAGLEPIIPNKAITCLFTNGVCATPNIYTLVNATEKTYLTVSSGSLISEVDKMVTVLPSTEFQIVVANKSGGPAVGAIPAAAYEGVTVLNTDLPGITFYAAIADIGGNYLRDATLSDNIVWSAVKPNGTLYTEINPDLTPQNGGSDVKYGLTKTVIVPNTVRIRAEKTGLNGDDTGNIQVDPGAPSQVKVWTQHNQVENAGMYFILQATILDAKGNLCTTTPTKAGISGSANGVLAIQNPSFGTTPTISYSAFPSMGSNPPLNFFNGTLIPLSTAVLTKAQKDPALVITKPTISMRVIMPAVELITTGFDLTGLTPPITVLPTLPKRISFREDTFNNNVKADDEPCYNMGSQFYMYNDPSIYYGCLDTVAGSSSKNFYTIVEDKGGNPLKWNGTAWEMTDLNGTPEPIVVDGWNPNGASLFNFSPVANTSGTVFNPIQAGYSTVDLKLNDPSKNINLLTTYSSLVTTGNVNTFYAETSDGAHGSPNLISAPNTFTLRLVALDSTGNTVFNFNTSQTFSFNISPLPTASPKATAANFPATLTANFVNGVAVITGLKLPNAKINKLTTFSGQTSVNGQTKYTNTVNMTVDVGPVDNARIRDNANDTGNNLTNTPLTFNADTPPTLFVASYDSELNFYRDEVATWSVSGTALQNAISIFTLAQSNPITPLNFGAGSNMGTITGTFGAQTVSTGQVSIIPGAYQRITMSVTNIASNTSLSSVTAGAPYEVRIIAADQYYNKITTLNGAKNLTFTTSGNGMTRKGYIQSLPANTSYNFVGGEVSPRPQFVLYNSAYTPRVVVDETSSVPTKTGQTIPLTVINDNPYNFLVARSTQYMNAGSNAYYYLYLQDLWGNTITSGGQQNAQVKFYFDSTLTGQDILYTNLASATINAVTDEATGNLNNGAGLVQITAQQAGTLKGNTVLTSGPLGNLNEIYDITVQPLTTVNTLQWVSGFAPQSNYTASKSVPFNEFKVEALDIYGNRVTSDLSAITLSVINPSSGTTAATIIGTTTKSLDMGAINFTDIKYPRAHSITLRATHAATGKFADAAVNVAAGLPNQALVILPGQSVVKGVATAAEAIIGSPSTQAVQSTYPATVYIMDEVFNPVLTWGNSVSVSITDDAGAVVTPAATNFSSGTATFNITSHKQGAHQIIPNASSILNNLTSSIFTVNPGLPSRLVAVFPSQTLNQGASTLAAAITTNSSLTQTAGVSFSVTVFATDDYFNIVNDSSTQIGLILNNDSLATYGTSLSMTNGAVTFPNVRYIKALASSQIGISIISSPNSYTNIHGSSAFPIQPNVATKTVPYLSNYQSLVPGQFTLSQAVSGTIPNVKAGTPLNVKVAIVDDFYNPITTYTTPISINLSDSNVTAPASVTPSAGEAFFTGVQWITTTNSATGQSTATGLTNVSLATFTVSPSDGRQTIAALQGQTFSPGKTSLANAVYWTAGAQNRTAGASYTVDVYLVDDYFNVIPSATDSVGITLTTDATAPAISAMPLTAGRATFNVTNTKAATNHTLKASSAYSNNNNSSTFNVLPNSAYQAAIFLPGENYNPGYTSIGLARTSAPNTQTAGTSFTATVRILDQWFNVVDTATGSFTITSNDVNATISNVSAITNGVGTAVITNYTANNVNNLTLSSTGYVIQHNSSNYIVIPESSRYLITVLDGLGEALSPGKQNYATAVSGTLTPIDADVIFNITVSARDKYFNLINDNTTVSITSPSDPFSILPASKALTNGSASFAIRNHKARYNYLAATGAGYTSVNSNNYWVNWLADQNLVILLPGQTLNSGASTLDINSTVHPNAITGTPSSLTSGQNATVTLYVVDQFFNQTNSTSGTYNYSLSFANDPYATTASSVSIVSSTATFNYLPLRATTQIITPTINSGLIIAYTTPFFTVNPGSLSKTEILLPNQTLITGSTSRTVAIAYPAAYTTNTDANFNVAVYALDAQHNPVTTASSAITIKDQNDINQTTYSGNLASGTATLSVEPVTPSSGHQLQVIAAPSITATHTLSDIFTVTIGTPSKVLVQLPGLTFTPARRTGLQGLTGTITQQTAGTSFTANVIVTDSKFNVAPVSWNINSSLLIDSYGQITPATTTTSSGSATVTIFNQLASNSHQIRVTPTTGALSGVPFDSSIYTVNPGAAEQTILVMNGQTHTPGPSLLSAAVTGSVALTAGSSVTAAVKLVDRYFNVVSSNAAGVSISDDIESGHISPPTTAFSSGVANFTLTPLRSGTHNLNTTYAGVALHFGSPLTVNPGAATQTIAYFNSQTYQNGVTTLASAITGSAPSINTDSATAVNIRVVDNYFNTVTSFSGTATLNTTDPVDTEPTSTVTSGIGSASINPVRTGTWLMSAAVAGKTAQSTNYTVTHGAPYQLVIKLPDQTFTPGQTSLSNALTPATPSNREAGLAFNVDIYLTDAKFNVTTSTSATVQASWINDSLGLINTATPLNLVAGSAALNVTPKLAGANHKVRITPTASLTGGSFFDSSAFSVFPSAPAHIIASLPGESFIEGSSAVSGTPNAQTAGNSFNVQLRVTDSSYNTVSNYTGTLNLLSTDFNFSTAGSLSLTSGTQAVGLIAVLSNTKTGVDTSTAWLLTPTSTNTAGITVNNSSFYSVNPNVSSKIYLSLSGQSYSYNTVTHAYAVSGAANTATVGSNYNATAVATDAYNNPTLDNSVQVGLTSSFDSLAVVSAPTYLSSGVANLFINHRKAGTSYNLASSSTPSLTSVTSSAYNVNPGSPYTLVGLLPGESISSPGTTTRASAVSGTPLVQTAGTAFTFTTKLVDQYYNAITDPAHNSKVVSLTLNNDNIAAAPANLNLTNGVAAFSVTNKKAASNLSITAQTTGLPQNSDTSSIYTVQAGNAAILLALLPGESHISSSSTVSGTPSTLTAGTSFVVTVKAVDQYYNDIPSFSGSQSLTFTTSAQSSPLGNAPLLASNGAYTFTSGQSTINSFTLYKAISSSGTISVNMATPALNATTSLMSVQPASALNSLKIRNAANNLGSEVGVYEYSTLDPAPNFYAAGYDVYGNYKSDVISTWSAQRNVAGDLNSALNATSGSTVQLSLTTAGPGSATLQATASGPVTASTGALTITEQGAHHFLAELETVGNKTAGVSFNLKITAQTSGSVTASQYVGTKSMNFSTNALSGSAGCTSANVNPEFTASASFTSGTALIPVKLKKAESARQVTVGTASVASGTTAPFNILASTLACLQLRSAASGGGSQITSPIALSAFQNSVLYAHGYDENMNSVGDQSATWSGTGNIASYFLPTSGTATWARATGGQSGSGTLTATISGLTQQVSYTVTTGGITVSSTSLDLYNKNQLLANSLEAGYLWPASNDEATTWRTNSTLSWYSEATTSCSTLAHRGCRLEFPERAIISVTAQEISIVDAKTLDLYLRFVKGAGNILDSSLGTAQSITARNGRLFIGFTNGLLLINFDTDEAYKLTSTAHEKTTTLSNRNNGAVVWTADATYPSFSNYNFKKIKSYYETGVNFFIAGLSSAIQVMKVTAPVSLVNGPTTSGALTALDLTSTGGIYYAEANFGLHFAQPNYSALAAFSATTAKDVAYNSSIISSSQINDLRIEPGLSSAEAGNNIIYMATQEGLSVLHEHSTPSQRLFYNYGLSSDGRSGMSSYLSQSSTSVSGAVSIADHVSRPSTEVTIEFFFKPQSLVSGTRPVTVLVDKATNSTTNGDFGVILDSNSSMKLYTYQGGALYTLGTSSTVWNAQQWYHVAAQINSTGKMSLWIDGNLINTVDMALTPSVANSVPVRLYSNPGYSNSANTDFNFDELRISNIARYTFNAATITVPATPFGNDASTSYLLHFDSTSGTATLTDSSSANATVTTSGGVHVMKPFFSGTQRNLSVINSFNSSNKVSGHIVSGLTGKLIELRNMENPTTISEFSNVNSSNAIGVDYYNKNSATSFDYIQWNTSIGITLWAR